MLSISTHSGSWPLRFTRVFATLPILLIAADVNGQLAGKTPDRGVYEPPRLILGPDGEAHILPAKQPAGNAKLVRGNKLLQAASSPEFRAAPASSGGTKQVFSANEHLNEGTRARDRFKEFPKPVLSDRELAQGILKPGEEGNRFRPLVDVSVDQSLVDSFEGGASFAQSHQSKATQVGNAAAIADFIRAGKVHPNGDVVSTTHAGLLEQQLSSGSNSEEEAKQVSYQQELIVEQRSQDQVAFSNEQLFTVDAKENQNSRHTTLASFPLSQITRFATLPLRVGRSEGGFPHDATCDGCDACGPSECDEIGCGIFGCGDCDVPCDTLGCDAIGNGDSFGFGRRVSRGDLFSLASSQGPRSVSSGSTHWFGGIDYLMMWRRGVRLPALVTTEVTDASGTREEVIVGDDRIMTRMTSGVRITTGRWFDRDQTFGFVGRGWYGGRKQYGFDRDQSQTPILLRPFLDYTDQFTPTPDTQVIAEPGRADGAVSITGDSEAFGLDLSFRRFLGAEFGTTMDLLYGYQFVRFNERLDISTQSVSLDDDFAPVGSTFAVRDSFHTFNEFHGAQIGLQTDYREGFWSFQGFAKLAFGSLSREALRDGETTIQVDSSISTDPEGLLVRDTNRGRVTNQHFSWVPEIDATLGWHRYEGWDLTLGYHLLAVTDAIQPCGTIDRELGVNLSDPLTGAVRPSADLRYRTFYLHGIHFGLQRVY